MGVGGEKDFGTHHAVDEVDGHALAVGGQAVVLVGDDHVTVHLLEEVVPVERRGREHTQGGKTEGRKSVKEVGGGGIQRRHQTLSTLEVVSFEGKRLGVGSGGERNTKRAR